MNVRAFGVISLTFCFCAVLRGQSPDEPNYGPVQAELLKHVNVRQLASGDAMFAKVTLDWKGPHCVLREGAILEGKVETADVHKLRSESKLALSFTKAQCNGTAMVPLDLVLAAVADTPVDYRTVQDSQFRMPSSFSNPHGGGMLAGFGSAASGDLYNTHLEMMGITHRFPMGPKVKPGAVLGLKGMKLEIAAGPNRSSVLSMKDHDVSLSAYTQLLLVPAAVAFASTKVALGVRAPVAAADTAAAPVPVAASPNNFEVCAPPGCAVDLPATPTALVGHSAGSIAAGPLGYAPRSHKIMGGFDDEEVLTWLGPETLLFTFNSHRLIRRTGVRKATTRVVRAVLLDTRNRSIIRALDWEIGDAQRFLWQLDGKRILVHVGNELRVYGAGLEFERSIPLSGPLSFVRIAPNGELMAVGTLHERHTQELHAQLREDLGGEPEEDVGVTILDKSFNTVSSFMTISGLLPPTLLNEGQVKLLAQPKLSYRLAMSTWGNATSTLARFDSRCTPQLSSMAPDFLFLLSCDAQNGDTEYRVMRPDGKLVLRGKSNLQQMGFEAAGNGQVFAFKVVHALREITRGADFTGFDLDSEEVRVYRASDGKRLFTVRVKDPATCHGSYALSADGSQLAVLSGSEIKLFAVPAE